jgi:mRNA interferase RelE/StbE
VTRRTLDYTRDFLKALNSLPAKHFKQVVTKALALTSEPFPSDSKALHGHEGLFRIDSGEYRIVYAVMEDAVQIILVGKRNDDEVYRQLSRKL